VSISTAALFICSLIFKEFYCFKRFELLNLGLLAAAQSATKIALSWIGFVNLSKPF